MAETGRNRLDVRLARYGTKFVASFVVGRNTGVIYTSARPQQLELKAPPSMHAMVGDRLRLQSKSGDDVSG